MRSFVSALNSLAKGGSMKSWNGNCQRCCNKTNSYTMSWFNTQLICDKCSDAECSHPKYDEAREAELKEIHMGNYNFPGIGL